MPSYKPASEDFKPRQIPDLMKSYFEQEQCSDCLAPLHDGSLMMVGAIHALLSLSDDSPPRPVTSVLMACSQCGRLGRIYADMPMDHALELMRQVYLDHTRYLTLEQHGGEAWPTQHSS